MSVSWPSAPNVLCFDELTASRLLLTRLSWLVNGTYRLVTSRETLPTLSAPCRCTYLYTSALFSSEGFDGIGMFLAGISHGRMHAFRFEEMN